MALASALEQTRQPVRVLVVADGCTDETVESVRALGDQRVEVLDRPKAYGCGYVHRNEVLERARGGVVAWLADDDLWLPDHLERLGEFFDAGAADVVNAMACRVQPDGRLEAFGVHWRAPSYRDVFLGGENRTPSSAVCHLADAALRVGGWPSDLKRAGDWDLWQRLVRAGARSEMIAAPTVLFFSAWERDQRWPERVAQNSAFLARLRDPVELARLRGEMALACSAGAHADAAALKQAGERELLRERELAAAGEREAAMKRELAAARAEQDRLAGELEAITSGTWWGLRRPLEPLLQIRRRVRGRARTQP